MVDDETVVPFCFLRFQLRITDHRDCEHLLKETKKLVRTHAQMKADKLGLRTQKILRE